MEDLKEMISNVHEALEGRYDLTGYDLHMIHGLLCEFDVLSNSNNKPLVKANVSVAVCDCCNGTGTVPVVNGFMFKDCPKCTHTER